MDAGFCDLSLSFIYAVLPTGIGNEKSKIYGLQFHPEVDLTPQGKTMLKNFLYNISGLSSSYTLQSREMECIRYIQQAIGQSKVLVMLFSFFNLRDRKLRERGKSDESGVFWLMTESWSTPLGEAQASQVGFTSDLLPRDNAKSD